MMFRTMRHNRGRDRLELRRDIIEIPNTGGDYNATSRDYFVVVQVKHKSVTITFNLVDPTLVQHGDVALLKSDAVVAERLQRYGQPDSLYGIP